MNDDLIRKAAAIGALAEMYCKSDEDGYVWIIRSDAWLRIDALPSVQKNSDIDEAVKYMKSALSIPRTQAETR